MQRPPKSWQRSVDDLSVFRAIGAGAGEGEGEIECCRMASSSSTSPKCEFSRLVSFRLSAKRFAEQDEEQQQVQVQGAGGLQSGRSKGELAARWLDRIET